MNADTVLLWLQFLSARIVFGLRFGRRQNLVTTACRGQKSACAYSILCRLSPASFTMSGLNMESRLASACLLQLLPPRQMPVTRHCCDTARHLFLVLICCSHHERWSAGSYLLLAVLMYWKLIFADAATPRPFASTRYQFIIHWSQSLVKCDIPSRCTAVFYRFRLFCFFIYISCTVRFLVHVIIIVLCSVV